MPTPRPWELTVTVTSTGVLGEIVCDEEFTAVIQGLLPATDNWNGMAAPPPVLRSRKVWLSAPEFVPRARKRSNKGAAVRLGGGLETVNCTATSTGGADAL